MNKLLLLIVSAVAIVESAKCPPRGTQCDACKDDIGSFKCQDLYESKTLAADCKAYIECRMGKSKDIDTVVCPAYRDRERVCLDDFTGDLNDGTTNKYECKGWAKKGTCFTNNFFMIPYCMTSCCHVCAFDAKGCPKPGNRDKCRNAYGVTKKRERKCQAWADVGECDKNPIWMMKNCNSACCPSCRPKAPARVAPTPGPATAPKVEAPAPATSPPKASPTPAPATSPPKAAPTVAPAVVRQASRWNQFPAFPSYGGWGGNNGWGGNFGGYGMFGR